MRYGIKCDGLLVLTYDTPEEAYESAQLAYQETGVFHEVVLVINNAKDLAD